MKAVVANVALGLVVLSLLAYFCFVVVNTIFRWKSDQAKIIRDGAPFTIGIPASAVAAFALVWLLPIVTGDPIEITLPGGGEFSGPASQIVFWLLCFLSFAVVVRMFWSMSTAKKNAPSMAVYVEGKDVKLVVPSSVSAVDVRDASTGQKTGVAGAGLPNAGQGANPP